jgi:hypothetical protein
MESMAGPSAGARPWFCGVEAKVGRGGVSSADEAGRSGASGSVSGRVVLALQDRTSAVVVEGATRLYSC